MTSFRLQTFEPGAPDRNQAAARAEEAARRLEAAREEIYRAGFIDGQAAATEAHVNDEARLTGELIEAIGDSGLTNEAARRHVAASLAPVVQGLFDALAPTLAEAGLASEIVGLVANAIDTAPNARPRLRCAPEVAVAVRTLLGERGLDAKVEEAPELLPREAQLFWDQGYDHIDLDACVTQIMECLAVHLAPAQDETGIGAVRHG